jgi:hypothetical protein
MKGMAFENSFRAQDYPPDSAELFDSFIRILGTSGKKPAMIAQQRGKYFFIEPDQ